VSLGLAAKAACSALVLSTAGEKANGFFLRVISVGPAAQIQVLRSRAFPST